jgi:hypothetical protein
MPKKVQPTKTLNPLHFEDLEPHRFEDLIRRLLYSFRDWSEIQPTGRGGSDEGFDIRAWERTESVTNVSDEGEEGAHLSDGNLWQVQGKREKSINPAKMRTLVQEGINGDRPPYGYILAAATNITKKTYDVFRAELRKKGVREFHFWGKDHLEDQLALPENDEILFTFFGISLSPRRRSRTTEIKFNLNNKNKMLKILFDREEHIEHGLRMPKSMLLRDMKDRHYPYKKEYPDFEKRRRWAEYEAVEIDATGLEFKSRNCFAYLDTEKKEWDYAHAVNLIPRRGDRREQNDGQEEQDLRMKVEHYWRHLPHRFQARLECYAHVKFEDMLVIDEKGDPEYPMPHIFIDFHDERGPFTGFYACLTNVRASIYSAEFESDYKRIKVFPETFSELKQGKIYELEKLGLTGTALQRVQHPNGLGILYSFDGKLDFLFEGDLIRVPPTEKDGMEEHVEITHVYKTTVAAEVKRRGSDYYLREMEECAGRKVTEKDQVTIYEIIEVLKSDRYSMYIDRR